MDAPRTEPEEDPPSHLAELAAEAELYGTGWPEDEPEPPKRRWWQWWRSGG